jgi:acyl carrier protein
MDTRNKTEPFMLDRLRTLLSQYGGLSVDVATLQEQDDLYQQGMSSFASVQLMLALEEAFDIEFPESMLSPKTFSSLGAIRDAIDQLKAAA